MAVFRKVIARPGKYLVRTLDGKRATKNLTKSELAKAVKTGNEMLADGLLIPGPYGHSDGKHAVPVPLTANPDDPNSFLDAQTNKNPKWDQAINGGFWRKFEQDKDGSFVGYIEADGDENDPNTHAGRIGKTFLQTSPLLLGQWIDGKGNLRENAPLHICLTNKAVEMGQQNFQAMPKDQELAIAMSFSDEDLISMSMDDNEADDNAGGQPSDKSSTSTDVPDDPMTTPQFGPEIINKLKTELKTKLKVTLPDDTDSSNFLDRLLTILTNLEPEEEEESDFNKEPKEGEVPKTPVVMSLDLETTTKRSNGILTALVAVKKQTAKDRIEALVRSGKVGRNIADKTLIPLVDGFAMSLDDVNDDGTLPPTALEMSLDVLEQNDSLVGEATGDGKPPADGVVPGKPADMTKIEEATPEQVAAILDPIFPAQMYPVTL